MSGSGPTKRIDDWKAPERKGGGGGDRPTIPAGGGGGVGGGFDHATQMPDFALPKPPAGGGKDQPAGGGEQRAASHMSDPVVGWLVIVKGPGQGVGLKLGVGMNTVGRGDENRVAINFGDSSISRDKHCIVTYEPRGRHFYIQNEGGQHLTYVGDAVVLQAQRLHNGERIQIGNTELRFIAFCGEDFAWDNPT